MQIEAGKNYLNGWGAMIEIISAPTDRCPWFKDVNENSYHADGAFVQIGGPAQNNLLSSWDAGFDE